MVSVTFEIGLLFVAGPNVPNAPGTEEEIPAPEAPMPDDNCHLEFDAMATMDDGSVLAFAGNARAY